MPRFDPQFVDTRPPGERDLVSGRPKQIAGCDPITWHVWRPELTHKFSSVLETASDEKPLQIFFEEYPEALLTGLVKPHTGWVISRPKLPKPDGGGWIPDFIICEWKSVGPDWIIVELKSPRASPLTNSGRISGYCNRAAEQINDYKTHIEKHGHFLREGGWPNLHGQCDGVIVIGRRDDSNRSLGDKLASFKRQRIEIASYDRLLEECQWMQDYLFHNAR